MSVPTDTELQEQISKSLGWWGGSGKGYDCYPEKTEKVMKLFKEHTERKEKEAFTAGVAMSGGNLEFQEAFYDQWLLNLRKETPS